MTYKTEDNYEEIQKEFENQWDKKLSNDSEKEHFMLDFNQDIFFSEVMLILKHLNSAIYEQQRDDFINKIKNIEEILLDYIAPENRYFSVQLDKKMSPVDNYFSLKVNSYEKLGDYGQKSEKVISKTLKKIFSELTFTHSTEQSIHWLGYGKMSEYDRGVFCHCSDYRRKILNASISTVLNADISDKFEISKQNRRMLKYYELRLLVYLRNYLATDKDFSLFATEVLSSQEQDGYESMDASLLEVLNIFKDYVGSPEQVDILILTHKYVSSVWRNGSRYLYFYTMHNQEHSVELIKAAVTITQTLDFIHIKSSDFYVLFLACYLHDISMILQPDVENFLMENPKSNLKYSSFLENGNQNGELEFSDGVLHVRNLRKFMLDAFNSLSNYFESLSRDNHVKESGTFIRTNRDLNFIPSFLRELTANVSESHGYEARDVYSLKSNAKSSLVGKKYMMMLLRLADLLDMKKDRVSLSIMRQNIHTMPPLSQYHWITHAAIDDVTISSTYDLLPQKSNNDTELSFTSILNQKYLEENLTIELSVNQSNLTAVSSKNCQNVSSDRKDGCITLNIGKGPCQEKTCTFLCKWLISKNEYLISELFELHKYLQRVENQTFQTNISVKLNYKNAKKLNPAFLKIIENHFD